MSETEKINTINGYCNWEIIFQALEKVPQSQKNFNTVDELRIFLQNEIAYWKLRETDVASGVLVYSKKFEDVLININETIEIIKIDSTEQEINYAITTKANEHSIIIRQKSINVEGKKKNFSTIVLNVISSENANPDLVGYAYETLFTKGKTREYNYFISIGLNEHIMGNIITDYLRQSNNDMSLAVARFIGYWLNEEKFPNSNDLELKKINDLSEKINIMSGELSSKRNEMHKFIEKADEDLKNIKTSFEEWHEQKMSKMGQLEKTYEEKLHLEEPVQHWKKMANEQKNKARNYLFWTIFTSVLIVVSAALSVYFIATSDIDSSSFIKYSILSGGMITLMLYVLRVFIKLSLSAKHLEEEYNEKRAFTYFYLSLIQRGEGNIDEKIKLLIFNALFSKVETGLIKQSESNSDLDALLLALLGKNN